MTDHDYFTLSETLKAAAPFMEWVVFPHMEARTGAAGDLYYLANMALGGAESEYEAHSYHNWEVFNDTHREALEDAAQRAEPELRGLREGWRRIGSLPEVFIAEAPSNPQIFGMAEYRYAVFQTPNDRDDFIAKNPAFCPVSVSAKNLGGATAAILCPPPGSGLEPSIWRAPKLRSQGAQ